jgi:hypothetical protein
MNASPSPTTANTRSSDPCQAGQLFVTSGQSHSIRQRTAGLIICRSLRINVRMDDLRSAVLPDPHRRHPLVIGVIRVIEEQITTLRPYNGRYTGDHRS